MLTCDPCPKCEYPFFVMDPAFPDRVVYACPGCGERFTHGQYHEARKEADRIPKKIRRQSHPDRGIFMALALFVAVMVGLALFL